MKALEVFFKRALRLYSLRIIDCAVMQDVVATEFRSPCVPLVAEPRPGGFRVFRVKGNAMSTGTVKWFNDSKGFGFIKPDGGGEDLFAHFSEIQGSGFKTLKENQKVEFEVKDGPKGKQATQIRPIG